MSEQPPPPHPAFLAQLRALAEDPHRDRTPFYESLMQTQLLLLLHRPYEPGSRHGQLEFLVEEAEGRVVVPCFTDLDAVGRYFGEARVNWASIGAREICLIAASEGFDAVEIDPGGPYPAELSQDELRRIASMPPPEITPIAEGTEATIGLPVVRPSPRALAELRKAIARENIAEAYWFFISIGRQPEHLGIALTPFDRGLSDRLARAIKDGWARYYPQNPQFSLFPLEGEFADRVREVGERLI